MRSSKNFSYSKGKYYFTVKGTPNNITIHRKSLESASDAYLLYLKQGKDCEWLGQWDGKRFVENVPPAATA